MVDNIDLLYPLKQSDTFDEDEAFLKEYFIRLFELLFKDQLNDIHYYGMPHLGSANVVERFTKQDGLVVLRRPQVSALIMRVIYANWKSLSSKQGLAFLEFVLQMLWPNQWKIIRLYHSISRINRYPIHVTEHETENSFLTSRIFILMDDEVDRQELIELTPTLQNLVPAHIYPTVGIRINLGDSIHINMGAAMIGAKVGAFQYR
ncbi:TPA: hypothetical protein NM870_003363 [Acinetobacter baumannii]|nr:hypothetical protein [Acinetobacter baumannii]